MTTVITIADGVITIADGNVGVARVDQARPPRDGINQPCLVCGRNIMVKLDHHWITGHGDRFCLTCGDYVLQTTHRSP